MLSKALAVRYRANLETSESLHGSRGGGSAAAVDESSLLKRIRSFVFLR